MDKNIRYSALFTVLVLVIVFFVDPFDHAPGGTIGQIGELAVLAPFLLPFFIWWYRAKGFREHLVCVLYTFSIVFVVMCFARMSRELDDPANVLHWVVKAIIVIFFAFALRIIHRATKRLQQGVPDESGKGGEA